MRRGMRVFSGIKKACAALLCVMLVSGCTKPSSASSAGTPSSAGEEPAVQANAAVVEFLDRMDQEVHPGVMGVSIASVSCAAAMMDWYVDNKPSEDEIRASVQEHLKNEDDVKSFRTSVEIVSYAAEDVLTGDVTKASLEDAGFTGEARWTEEDVRKVFGPILDEIPEN